MTERVFLHIGLPKTGTTYLQRTLWDNKAELAEAGLLLPGRHRRRHLLASMDLRGDPKLAIRAGDVAAPWADLVTESLDWQGDVLVSHEFFGPASPDQIRFAVESLAGADVHVIITAREMVGLAISRWQEYVRNGGRRPIDDYPPDRPYDPADAWGWSSFDLADILDRWGSVIDHGRIHVLPMVAAGGDPSRLLTRFLAVMGYDGVPIAVPKERVNEGLGLVEAELLRRTTQHMTDFRSAPDRGNWIRGYLATPQVMPPSGEKFRPSDARLADLVERGHRAMATLAEGGYDVVGDLSLLEPADVSDRRHPDDVTDTEQLDVAVQVIAALMTRVRELTREQRALAKRREPERRRVSVSRFVTGLISKIRKDDAS
ncbi:MAG TPA: hypothetical protein VFM08_10645 [Nocardioides sp.]|nr:hypothetical protein [Nocardioides sp.]